MALLANPTLSNLTLSGYSINGVQLGTGTLTEDNTWDAPDVVYYLDNDVHVAEGVTLTIAPGMVIKGRYYDDAYYDGNDLSSELKVSGTLLAQGTPDRPIVFTSTHDDWHGGDTNNNGDSSVPGRGGWGGLRFYASSQDSSILDHVQVWYAGRDNIDARSTVAITFSGASPDFTNGMVRSSLGDGIVTTDYAENKIENTLFAYNAGGWSVNSQSHSRTEIINCTFNANKYGVVGSGADWMVARNNIFSNHAGTALQLTGGTTGLVEHNLFFDNPTHTSGVSPSPIGINGNIEGDPLYLDLSLGDHRLRDGSPAIDAATSMGAPDTDQDGYVRYDDPNVANTGFGFYTYYDIGCHERQEPSRPVDLVVESVQAMPAASVNEDLLVQYTVRNTGEIEAKGDWVDALFLSADAVWDPADALMGHIQHQGGLDGGKDYTTWLNVPVPGAVEGDYHVIVKTDHGENLRSAVVEVDEVNNATASDVVAIEVPELTLGQAMEGQFPAADTARYYKVTVEEGMSLRVALDDANGAGANELYVRYGAVPTRTEYDARGGANFAADQEAWIGLTEAGTYYILVYGDHIPDAPASFEVKATTMGFGIEAVTPDAIGNNDHAVIVLHGSAFEDGATVLLRRDGQDDIAADDVIVASGRVIQATFDLEGAAPGLYEVILIQDAQEHLAMQGFEVQEARQADVDIEISGPKTIRRGRTGTFTITMTNRGNATAPYAMGRFRGPNECAFETVRITSPAWHPQQFDVQIDPSVPEAAGGRAVYFAAYDLAPGQSAALEIKVRNVVGGGHQHIPMTAETWVLDQTQYMNYFVDSFEDVRVYVINHPSEFPQETIEKAQDRAQWDEDIREAIEQYDRQRKREELRQKASWSVHDTADLLLAAGLIVGAFVVATITSPVVGPSLVIAGGLLAFRVFMHKAIDSFTLLWESITSWDPNDKIGPGHGESGYVRPLAALPYTIRFENLAAASAPAQEIVITDQLDAKLDWPTFELTEIGFGEHVIDVPDGLAHWEGDVPLGEGLLARVNAGLDIETGLFTTHLICLDEATGLFPEDPFVGLLPPNQTPPEGEGWVSFRVDPVAGLGHLDEIHNQATIVFDTNPLIDTNVVTNTIDDNVPTSSVAPLPPQVTGSFEVAWSGDDADGAGVATYAIHVSDNDGPFVPWLITEEQSATFAGQPGHVYAFYSVARDWAGHEEAAPPEADATTQVWVDEPDIDLAAGATASDLHELDFAYVTLGAQASQSVVVTNRGTGALTIDSWALGDAAFEVTPPNPPGEEGDVTLAPEEQQIIQLTFTPDAMKGYATALTVLSNDPDEPRYVVALSGTCVPAALPPIEVADSAGLPNDLIVDFGAVDPGAQATHQITLTNRGEIELTLDAWTSSRPDVFALAPANPPGPAGDVMIPPGGSTVVDVTFLPAHVAGYGAALTVSCQRFSAPLQLAAIGTGAGTTAGGALGFEDPLGEPDDRMLEFGAVPLGQEAMATIIASNIGDEVLTITECESMDRSFTIVPQHELPWTLAPGQDVELAVTFAPDGTSAAHAAALLLGVEGCFTPRYVLGASGKALLDLVPPHVVDVRRGTGPERFDRLDEISVRFDEDVLLPKTALVLYNETTDELIPQTPEVDFRYDPATYTACWDLPAPGLPYGRYTAKLAAAKVVDVAGNPLDVPAPGGDSYEMSFLVTFPGDATLDGKVDALDYLTIKRNFAPAEEISSAEPAASVLPDEAGEVRATEDRIEPVDEQTLQETRSSAAVTKESCQSLTASVLAAAAEGFRASSAPDRRTGTRADSVAWGLRHWRTRATAGALRARSGLPKRRRVGEARALLTVDKGAEPYRPARLGIELDDNVVDALALPDLDQSA